MVGPFDDVGKPAVSNHHSTFAVGQDSTLLHAAEDSTRYPTAGQDPVLYRSEVEGPRALDIVSRVFGGPLPEMVVGCPA